MPFGSKMSFTQNKYKGKANIPSYTTTNFDQENNTIKDTSNNIQSRQAEQRTQSLSQQSAQSNTNGGTKY